MAFRFNPFTGTFDDIGGTNVIPGTGASIPFVVADWVLSAGLYQLDLQHNLESEDVSVEVYEGDTEISVHRIQIINTNTIRIYVTFNPDCRFDGKAIILTT
jgi:hypothetical protein